SGSLTFVSGFLADRPSASSVLQGAINAALEGLARGLALELAPVRVNAVSPGMIDTPLFPQEGTAREEFFELTTGDHPIPRPGHPGEVAEAILFLLRNDFTTGTIVDVDGGALLP
ncbi:MAG: SDR family oxidoreductase, partial [Verrucomicrobiota bacterium]|nr:SDR family oxidoreductase [Verrucomicrobiota bacterium]